MQGERVPVIHTVGFFAEEQRGGPGERFLRQLSALAGGTFQVSPLSYCPALPCPAIPYHALPCLLLSCPALPWPALSCPVQPLHHHAMPICTALLCCSGLYKAAGATAGCTCRSKCISSSRMLSLTMHAVSHNACCLSQCMLSLTMHLVLLHATCLPHSPCPTTASILAAGWCVCHCRNTGQRCGGCGVGVTGWSMT